MTKSWVNNSKPEYLPLNEISPLSILKIPFRIKSPVITDTGKVGLNIALVNKIGDKEEILSSISVPLKIVFAGDIHKETFISKIDNTVQYYAVTPPVNLKEKPALFCQWLYVPMF